MYGQRAYLRRKSRLNEEKERPEGEWQPQLPILYTDSTVNSATVSKKKGQQPCPERKAAEGANKYAPPPTNKRKVRQKISRQCDPRLNKDDMLTSGLGTQKKKKKKGRGHDTKHVQIRKGKERLALGSLVEKRRQGMARWSYTVVSRLNMYIHIMYATVAESR